YVCLKLTNFKLTHFLEYSRFWRSLKYDYVYLNPADDDFELYEGIQNHIGYQINKIHHTTLKHPITIMKKTCRLQPDL
ncbi:hypothetical protein, partial [Umezakia ovalisporum]|uniref:hypothetical protein n=1 Tax=Umezakia ovalisporum TaxID=75695 RepID=UPI0039C634BA